MPGHNLFVLTAQIDHENKGTRIDIKKEIYQISSGVHGPTQHFGHGPKVGWQKGTISDIGKSTILDIPLCAREKVSCSQGPMISIE